MQIDYYREGSPDPVLICRQKFVYLGGSVIRELDDSEPNPQVVKEYIRDGGLGGEWEVLFTAGRGRISITSITITRGTWLR